MCALTHMTVYTLFIWIFQLTTEKGMIFWKHIERKLELLRKKTPFPFYVSDGTIAFLVYRSGWLLGIGCCHVWTCGSYSEEN